MTGYGGDDRNVATPQIDPAPDEVGIETVIFIGGREYRMDLDPDGITSRGTNQYGPGADLADRIAEAMHRAVWYEDGTLRPEVAR